MFSNFLSGANPLSSVSSAVRGGLFGDNGEVDKQKAGAQHPGSVPGPGNAPQQQQGGPQLQGNGQAGQAAKLSGQQAPAKGGPQQQGPPKGGPQQQAPHKQGPAKGGPQQQATQQQGPAKGGSQQQGSPKVGAQTQGSPKVGAQTQGSPKIGAQTQGSPKVGAQTQGSPKIGAQTQGSPKVGAQTQGSPKIGAQTQGSPKVGAQTQGSPKVGAQTQGSPKIGTQQQGSPRTTSQQQAAGKAGHQSKDGPMAGAKPLCPVCNTTGLNLNTKEPPNHNTCTQCKTVVCSLCGFSPPDSGGKEWLCLTCQMQRALGGSDPPGTPKMKPQPSPNKASISPAPQKKDTSTQGSIQKNPAPSATQPPKAETAKAADPQTPASPVPARNAPQENRRTSGPQKPPEQPGQPGHKQSNATPCTQQEPGKPQQALPKDGASPAKVVPQLQAQAPKQESGGFFGFGGPKSQPAASKAEDSVSGKMFGFGSSIFSSASTLITSTVQDEPHTTPPASPMVSAAAQASPKMPPAKETKPPATQKAEEKKAEQPQQAKVPALLQAKVDQPPSEPPKGAASSQPALKAGQSTCPLCKVELNKGSKDPPNYNTCTECKNTVCNLCGFNPMTNVAEVKEWLCLNCQMKRMEPTGPPMMKPQPSPNKGSAPQKATVTPIATQKKDIPTPGSPQRKPATSATEPLKADAARAADLQKPASPAPVMKAPQENRRTSGPQKPPEQPGQPGHEQSNATLSQQVPGKPQQEPPKGGTSPAKAVPTLQAKPPKQESGGFFGGFGGPKSQFTSKPEDSVSGKVFGFGSSIFSSASTLITSAVQDETHTTLPGSPKVSAAAQASPKMPAANETKPPATQKAEEKKAEQPQQAKVPASVHAKVDKPPSEPPKGAASSQPALKAGQSTCPLCKVELNMGSKDPPNYNTCTECKNTVCNLCGFNPMPNVTEVNVWLCLNCQMHRALGGMEPQGPTMMKPKPSPNKVSASAAPQKRDTPTASGPQKVATAPASPKKEPVTPASQPVPSKPEESVSGKMFGFGSSIFSSASTLITSAVQDEPRTTPPASPMVSAPVALQKQETPKPTGAQKGAPTPVSPKKEAQTPATARKKDTPMPASPQRKPDSPTMTAKQDQKHASPLKPGDPSGAKQGSAVQPQQQPPQQKTPQVQPQQTPASAPKAEPVKPQQQPPKVGTSPGPAQKTPQENRRTSEVQKPPQQPSPGRRQSSAIPSTQQHPRQESGGFFGFGGPKSQSTPSKPEEEVSGKMFGFGSSIFSSASTLITSAVQDKPHTTLPASPKLSAPASPKMPPAKETKPSAAQKAEEKKAEQPQQAKVSPSVQANVDKPPSETPKGVASSQPAPKAGQSTCPLCKVELNKGSKDPPNYNTCTECKNTVCNLCGFNPMPSVTEMKEWLCLNCQMQRALGGIEPPEPLMMKLYPNKVFAPQTVTITPIAAQKDITTPAASVKTNSPIPSSPQRKPVPPAAEVSKAEATKAADTQMPASPAQMASQGNRRASEPQKQPQQPSQHGRRQSSAIPDTQQHPKQESGGFFGFGGPKSQSTPSKPEESVSGKMFGFGSSIFSSASTLITSAVQDEPHSTPPASPKVSAPASHKLPLAKETKPPTTERAEETKAEQPQQAKAPPSVQAKVDQPPSEPPKGVASSQPAPKAGQSTCPLCKVDLNIDSKDPPNYNTCTECKNTVCNLCGFNPMPHVTEVKEWLCLNCQMQRALGGMETPGPLMMKPQPLLNKVSTPVAPQQETPASQKEMETAIPAVDQKKAASTLLKEETTTLAAPQKETPLPASSKMGETPVTALKQDTPTPESPQNKKYPTPPGVSVTDKVPTTALPVKKEVSASALIKEEPTYASALIKQSPPPSSALNKEAPTPASALTKEVTGSPLTKEAPAPASPQKNKEPILPGSQNRKVAPTPGSTQDNYAVQSGLPLKKEAPLSTAVETKEVQHPAAVQSNEAPVPDSLKTKENTTVGTALKKEASSTEISIDNQKPAIVQKSMEPPATPTNKQNEAVQPLQQPEKQMPAQEQPLAQVQPQEAPKSDPKSTPPKQELGKPASPAPAQKALENRRTSEPQTPPQQPSQSSAIPSTQQPPKQESGGLFGFGGPKSQSTPSKPEESVSGKMFGFGSSIFSSASTLITSAVHDETRTTPPASPKMFAPASPKMPPAKETKLPASQKAEEKKAEQPQQAKVPQSIQAKVDNPPSKPPKGAESSQPSPKAGQSTCPLCKVELNKGSKDPPNYNTCTECKNTVCNLCGFNPMPHETEEWLCLNCQMQRALGGMEPPGPPMIKSQPLPSKVSTPAASQKLTPAPAKPQKEEIPVPAAAQKEIPPPTVPQETLIPAGTPSTAVVKKEETPAPGSPQNKHAPPAVAVKDKQEPIIVQKPLDQTIAVTPIPSGAATPAQQPEKQTPSLQQPDAKPPPQLQPQQVPKIDPKIDPLKQEPGKPQQQLPKGGTSPAKAASQPQAKPPKQSVGFFGFGGAKSQPAQSKPEESVSGKVFGFGSSIFSSASTLITSAVQDETHTTPPASPMVSAAAQASPKMSPAKETKPPATQKAEEKKAEQPQQAKVPTLLQAKVDQPPSEPPKGAASSQPALKAGQSTCPLCKVELNKGSKDPPNYNTCTECKNTVCNLCGFNPMPHETEEWLCLNCQTQRALSGQLGDMGMMAQPQLTKIGAQPTPQPVATSTKTEPQFPAATTTKAQAVPLTSEPIPPTLTPALAQKELEPKVKLPEAEAPNAVAKAEAPKTEVLKVKIAKTEAPKMESSVAEVPTSELPKPVPPKSEPPKTPVVAAPVVSVPVTEAMTAPAPLPTTVATAIAVTPATVEAKAQPAELHKPTEEKVEKPAEEKVEKPLKQQKPVPVTVAERVTPQPVPTADTIKKVAAPLVEKVDDVLPEPQQILTEKETVEEEKEPTADSLLADQVVVEVPSSPASPFEADTKIEDHSIKSQDGPDILPISQGSYSSEEELKELQTDRNVPMNDTTADTAMPSKEEVNVEKRRLNYVQMEESSGSEPSPQVQRRRLSAIAVSTAASSSSEDYKADSPAVSPDSSVDEEEFIRRQIMGMTGEEEMFLSEEEKDEKESREEETKEAEVDNESGKSKLLLKKGIMANEDSPARRPSLPGSEAKTTADSSELTTTVFKKDMMLQRTKSTDDGEPEVESITESLEDKSKGEGSSSVQVSSFTPGTSPTSASSLEEDSDSSPSHKRSGEGKQHRKAKHRQAGQFLPTIEDSSEEEELREEEDHLRDQDKQKESDQQQGKRSSKKSKRDKDELQTQRKWDKPVTSPSNLSPIENASPTVEVRQAREMEVFHKSSASDYSPSMESDSEAFHTEAKIAVPKGQKFSTAEPLKSAEEVYEEMLQKARSPNGETEPVPEIEPLYGGMAIEDYLYESLVEEPEAKPSSARPEQPSKDHAKEPGKKSLRSPEEVYEEMMQKKKELMLIEQEFQRAQSAMDTPNPEIHVTAPSSAAAESCKVGEAEGEKPMLDADSTYVKRKKRPAPPRPSEPPKRPEVNVAKPTVPQDMTMRRALFPIPDLKITQCSSGEDETDDSIIEEYGVGVSSDITPSDESETKEQVESSPVSEHTPITEAAEIEPITVVCEVPQAKATPAPAPETVLATSTTTTTSPISPVSPPTSPATPDSSLASNATSSSSFQAPSPLSSDSTPVSTPTPDLAKAAAPFAAQPPADISPPSIAPIMAVSPTTVLVTIPDVVTDPTQAPTPATTTVHASAPLAQPQAPATVPASVVVHIPDPVVIQMPDLVTSPSQMSVQRPPSVQITAPTPVPSPVPSEATSPVPAAPSAMSTSAPVSAPTPAPAPVVVQMPDLVTITSSVSPQAPLPVTSSARAQATVVHSVPVQTAAPPPTPVVVPAIGTRRIQRQASTKKAPPPPPPRSTSVSQPQTSAEPTSIRAIHNVSPTVTTTIAMGAALPVVVNVQSLVEDVRPEGVAGSQVMMTPTRQGHAVIIVPNVENMSVLSQTTQDLVANSVAITTTSAVVEGSSQIAARPVVVSVAPFYTAPSVPAVHSSDTYIPLADTPTPPLPPPPPPATLLKPAVYPKKPSISIPPSVPTSVPVSAALTMAQATGTTPGPSPVHKAPAPPPVPPKPVSIPAGLVFSHRPGESVKPPVYPNASHTLPTTREVVPKASSAEPFTATTLPRTREPPNALSLSLTTPVESKMSATSPRSPLSPRNAKCLETYVVITLPSEPGTPTEGITVQAPIRRGSILPSKQTGPGVRTTPSEQQSPIEAFSAQDNVRKASVPSLRQPPPPTAAIGPVEVAAPLEGVKVLATARRPSIPSAMQPPYSMAEVVTVSAGSEMPIQVHNVPAPIKKPYKPPTAKPPQTVSVVMTMPSEPQVPVEVSATQASGRRASIPAVPQQPQYVAEVMALPAELDIPTEVVSIEAMSGRATIPSEMQQPQTMAEVMPLQQEIPTGAMATQIHVEATPSTMHQSPSLIEVISTEAIFRRASIPLEMQQPQTMAEVMPLQQDTPSIRSSAPQPQGVAEVMTFASEYEMPTEVITTEATTTRRTSISSVAQQPYTFAEVMTYPSEYETPTQVVTTEAISTTRRASITMQQLLTMAQVITMPAEAEVPLEAYAAQVQYRRESIPSAVQPPQAVSEVLSYSSEYETPLEVITTEAYTRRMSVPSGQEVPQTVPVAPVTITRKFHQESIESQEIRGPEKVVSSLSHVYSSSISTSAQPPERLPSLVTQVVTTEVQRTTVSVVHERLPQAPASDALAIPIQPSPKQNGKIYSGDAIDLRTIKVGVKMTDSGMDLTPQESSRQSVCSNSSGRHTAVQPEIVNLSAEITPSTTLAVVTDSITIVTCSATIASYTSEPAEKPLDLQSYVASMPLPLTTYKPFEPLAQIVYRRVDSPPIVSTVTARDTEIPINLSYGASTVDSRLPVTMAPAISNGGTMLSELAGAVDLSTSRPLRAMVALSGTSPGVVTTVVEDDGTPIDLTAGKNVCCDVIYKLPFTGSCRTQPPVITQPDNHFGYRDNHYQYDHAGVYGIKVLNGKAMSETNLADAGLFLYNGKTRYDYNGVLDSAVDLTAGNISAGEALDYSSKAAGAYTGISTAPYSQVPAYSVLRSSDGMVYSSIAAPVPSTYAITTQPGSIFSTTLPPTTTLQEQPAQAPYPYGFIPTTDPSHQIISLGTGLPKDLLPSALADIMTGFPALYSDQTLEAIAASLEALASLPMFPGLDDSKITQYQMEREFLQLEKLKQLCLAEELEWERQEIQRYREQEQIMVQRELEELQALKQKLLVQQEEEHQAHLVAQQETYNQQREQLEQIQQLQVQLQHQLEEHYGTTGTSDNLLEAQYAGVGDNGQYWPVRDESTTSSTVIQLEGGVQYVTGEGQREVGGQDQLQFSRKQSAGSKQPGDQGYGTGVVGKRIVDSGVQTDDEDSVDRTYVGRRKRNNRRGVDSSVQTDDEEDQEVEWDMPTRSRRRSRSSKHSGEGKHGGSKVSSIAIQTVAEISVQTDHSGSIKCPSIQMDTKVEIIKHISAPENSQRGGSLSCQTDTDRRRHLPVEVGYSAYLKADLAPKSPKVLYSPVSPLSASKAMEEGQKRLTTDPSRFSSGPRMLKPGPKSLPDPKSLSPTTEDRIGYHYTETYSGQGSPSGTGKKVKRTLPNPPPEDDPLTGPSGYSTNSARRRLGRHTTMARAKILQDIDKELDLVERESSKLRRKQAELDEEEKEIDAKLRYLEMGINRRKDALLQEREKRERAYLQGVAEERDYMSDSEVSNIRETRGNSHGLERPRTAPQSEFDQFIPPETEADSQYSTLTSPYSHYTQYVPQTQAISHYPQQTLYQQQALYQQHPYQSQSVYSSVPSLSYPQASHSHQQAQSSGYQSKNTTNYEVIRNQPMIIVPSSSEGGYGVGKYGSLELRMGLEERSMASSPMSSISAESFYADIDHHNARNYVLIEDIEQLTKGSTALGSAGLGSGFSLPDKDLSKADRLLRAAEARRTAEVAEFLGNSRLHSYGKGEEDSMEEPYELKLLKQQIKQEFRRGTEGLEHLSGLGMPQYLPTDPSYRHFPKADKYSISRLTLEKQAAKQLPAAVLYQKQIKNQKKAALLDPKITKFSSIQESRDLEPDYNSFLGSGASSVTNLSTRARLLQDEITFGLRKNLSEQQKYLDSSLGSNLAGSLGQNLGQSLGLGGPTMRTTLQDDTTYPSGTRSRPSSRPNSRPNSRPTSVYGLDLSIKRDLSSSSLRLKIEGEALDGAFGTGVARTKPTSLPISQSRGRIPIVAQNSEEESPLSPVGEPMGMARASAGPLPPISADSRDQFGSNHSLPEVQQHMREESRATLGHSGVYDRDIAFTMDDLGGAMSDSEALTDSMLTLNRDDPRIFHESIRHAGGPNWNIEAYHLRREDTDWFDKPAERQHQENGQPLDRRQIKLIPYVFPHTRLKLQRDPKDTSVSGNGLGIRVVGGKEIPGCHGEIGAYIAKVTPGGVAEQTGKVVEGMQVLELNGVPLMGKTYEEVQCIMGQLCAETELCVRLDLNMLSDPEHPQALENHDQLKPGDRQCSPGVDPKQLAAELQKVSQQQAPGMGVGMGVGGPGGVGVLSALDRSALLHSGNASASSSAVPSPGQPASPAIIKKQRHSAKSAADVQVLKPQPHPITGEIQLQINYDRNLGNLIVHVLQARNLAQRDPNRYSDPFVKVYLLPGRGQVMVVQNASGENKRRTKYVQRSLNPEWNQTVIYKNIHLEQLKKKTLEVTVWDYDKSSSNDFLGEVLIDLSNTSQLDNTPRWLPLKEQSESIEHSRAHHTAQGPGGPGAGAGPGQGPIAGQGSGKDMGPGLGQGQGQGLMHGQGQGQMEECLESPKNSVIKSRSHGIFPDPAKDMQMVTLEKSHSSPGSSKSSSDGQLRSHGPSRSQSKSSVTQAHLEDAGIAIAAAEAAVQQARLQPRPGHRLGDVSGPVVSSAPNLLEGYGGLDGEEGAGTGVDSAIFQVPRIGKTIPNGIDKSRGLPLSLSDNEGGGGKTQMMGEIKVALKKEVKQEGDQLVLEVLQCRNITYKFKSPDHLPDLYVKLYVVNVATQKRIIKKKTRVCRHDREPSFNETFRFSLNPTGHSLQLFLVSNGGKFMKKTLIGEAYIWLDKVDMRKRVVSWHKLLVNSTHNQS
ncbi:protein piccolo isoform X2 [Salmo salar]|uniref:Protein piccolo isoform X2 n=1 Tax=Salmo salar TaxID=8030 RepID=A0A1S3MLB1_SALSA|nr:protein piccolo-like isoform X2 [Salmo salar]